MLNNENMYMYVMKMKSFKKILPSPVDENNEN